MHHLQFRSRIEAPVEAVFRFHERPDAIRLLTPWFLFPQFKRLKGQGLEAGVELLITTGFVTQWHARHTEYEKNRLFVDEIVRGPMKAWRHEHRFEPDGSSCHLIDSIDFIPKGPVWLAEPGLRWLFGYRHRVTKEYCEGIRPLPRL